MSEFDKRQILRNMVAEETSRMRATVNHRADLEAHANQALRDLDGPTNTQAMDPNVGTGACSSQPSVRGLLNDLISLHYRRAEELVALSRALPGEMSYDAEQALRRLLQLSSPR